jgi:hypothetical protein
LNDRDRVQLNEPVGCAKSLVNQHGVQASEVGKDHELFEGCVITGAFVSVGGMMCSWIASIGN